MSTLYELSADYQALLEMAEDPETDAETLTDTLEALGGEIEDKAESYAKVIRQLEAEMAGIKAEEERLADRRKAMDGNITRMKEMLQQAMTDTGKTKFKTALFSFGIRKSPASVVLDAPVSLIPQAYLIPQEPKVDKKALSAAIKSGEDLSGIAHLQQSEYLSIR